MKLKKDFGVRALFGTILIAGALLIGFGGTVWGNLDTTQAFGYANGWVMAVIGFYFGTRK